MSDTYDQTSFDSSTSSVSGSDGWNVDPGPAVATPIQEIFDRGAADVTEPDRRSGEHGSDAGRAPDGLIPISALKAERARRREYDARIDAVEREIQKYNDHRWGFDDEAEAAQSDQSLESTGDHALDTYQRNHKAFAARTSREKLAEIDQALNRLTPSQVAEINQIAYRTGNPQAAVDYLDRAGLLFKRTSISDALDGNKPPDSAANAEQPHAQERMRALEAREQQIAIAERAHVERGSQASFAQHHGHETLMAVDAVVGSMLQRNHPLVPHLQQIYQSSPDPTGAVAAALHEWGMWSPEAAQPRRPVFPSNIAGARNVGVRSGPVWSGPAPLQDIFDRSRP